MSGVFTIVGSKDLKIKTIVKKKQFIVLLLYKNCQGFT